jgi:4-carboxymuconolactone decarboxylase
MSSERFDRGLAARKAVLGEAYVEANLAEADDFNREFQEVVTEFCWGLAWGDDVLTFRERSMINLGMIAALGRMHEWELHFRGAIGNGLTRDELRSVLHQITAYAGVPAGVECFRIARKVLAELDAP